jgi:hypothetical protein
LESDSIGSVDSNLKVNEASKFGILEKFNVFLTVNLFHEKIAHKNPGPVSGSNESGYKTMENHPSSP